MTVVVTMMIVGVIGVVVTVMVAIVMMVIVTVVTMMITVPSCGWSRAADCDYADNAHCDSDLP